MIDIHSHIIWGIDDGSKSEEMTLNILKKAAEGNTKKIIATPHFLRGMYECEYKDAKEKLEEVKALAKENYIDIEIYSGQEVYYRENILELYLDGSIGTINNSRYMLIELPMDSFSISEVIDNIYELSLKGIVPIMAHPERYKPFINNPELINKFIKEGFLFQLNMGSITGYFGKEVKKTAELFAEHKVYSFVGSDVHRDTGRSVDMTEGIAALEALKKGYSREIEASSEKLLNNEEIRFSGQKVEKKKKKGLFGFFRR